MSKFYIVAQAISTSGGPETLHQFAHQLKQLGCEAYVHYIDDKNASIPKKFEKYDVKVVNVIEDKKENVLIVPESFTDFLDEYKNIRKCIWWLSLDFYLLTLPWNRTIYTCKKYRVPLFLSPLMYLVLFMSKKLRHRVYRFKQKKDKVFHLYNCEYVKDYLIKKGVSEERMLYLCGPLRNEYFEQEVNMGAKENYILYNPRKGYEFTKKIIKRCNELNKKYKFVPIQNMTPSQIVELMKKAKLYIDFGYFPGPERIPREAVMLKCNIITSNIGSAKNSQDVLVPSQYKFDTKSCNLERIINVIDELVLNYANHIKEYDEYRDKVINQRILFENNTKLFVREMCRMESTLKYY